ncbi:MAG: enoyl-CoA hydratase-related protein [Geobacteraceae bacterium]|nr:enoyl-CoA hydratase-related protein [Geobacteraceae bacterium]
MDYINLLLEISGQIATITINRPHAMNSLTVQTLEELEHAFIAMGNDPGVRVILVTGAGEKAFVAGGDISYLANLGAVEARELALLAQRVYQRIEHCSKPVIAVLNGYALGGGCELALACDLRLASEKARIGQPEVNIGIIPGWGGTQRLPRLIGKGRALEMLFSGEMIDAREAWRIGLVNKVYPAESLMDEARALAGKISSKGALSIRFIKDAVQQGMEVDLQRANLREADLFALCFGGEEQKEGMSAFLEKRPAKFA